MTEPKLPKAINADTENRLREQLLETVDYRNNRSARIRHVIEQIENETYNLLLKELRENKMSAYEACMCIQRLTASHVAMERLKLEEYRTLTELGLPAVFVEIAEELDTTKVLTNKDLARYAEKLLVDLHNKNKAKNG